MGIDSLMALLHWLQFSEPEVAAWYSHVKGDSSFSKQKTLRGSVYINVRKQVKDVIGWRFPLMEAFPLLWAEEKESTLESSHTAPSSRISTSESSTAHSPDTEVMQGKKKTREIC